MYLLSVSLYYSCAISKTVQIQTSSRFRKCSCSNKTTTTNTYWTVTFCEDKTSVKNAFKRKVINCLVLRWWWQRSDRTRGVTSISTQDAEDHAGFLSSQPGTAVWGPLISAAEGLNLMDSACRGEMIQDMFSLHTLDSLRPVELRRCHCWPPADVYLPSLFTVFFQPDNTHQSSQTGPGNQIQD